MNNEIICFLLLVSMLNELKEKKPIQYKFMEGFIMNTTVKPYNKIRNAKLKNVSKILFKETQKNEDDDEDKIKKRAKELYEWSKNGNKYLIRN